MIRTKTLISLLVSSCSKGQQLPPTPTLSRVNFCPAYSQKCGMHVKARSAVYPVRGLDQTVNRFHIPDDKVSWSTDWEEYAPVDFTAGFVLTASWADPELTDLKAAAWNSLDGKVNRKSHDGEYRVEEGRPFNPAGRTGIKGRGVLGRWGPNHAADPIVTRWKRDKSGEIETNPETGNPVLEFVSIERNDGGGWAIPGGMVDPGECVSVTLKREFMEEAMDSTGTQRDSVENKEIVEQFFSDGTEVYKGYVDDPRNTDNAWMETVAVNFHDETGNRVGGMQLKAGDDAKNLKWQEINKDILLYASHKDFIRNAAEKLGAHW